MLRKTWTVSLLAFVFGFAAPTMHAASVTLDPATAGRPFEGIGAVSAGGNSRLLIDYEEPYRSDVLDFLFKPNFGASLPQLKVELGGGTNSTSGAEPSHAISPAEIADPVSRGYEFWLMKQARDRNPDVILDFLPWGFPYWLGTPFTNKQDYADYYVAFMQEARDEWGVTVDWVSAAKNEANHDIDWTVNYLRPTMDAAGFQNVHIQSPDAVYASAWNIFYESAYANDPQAQSIIEAIGYHYIDQYDKYPSQAIIDTGKTLWCSEDRVWEGDWYRGREIIRRMNRLYTLGRITQMQIWCPVDSCADGVRLGDTGIMQADTPWSGHYTVRPAIWAVAHYNQFVQPGWLFLDGACGALSGDGFEDGNYVTLKDPDSDNWSMIIFAETPETFNVTIVPGLSTGPVHVWRSTESEQFVQLADIVPAGSTFTLNCSEANAVYSITTTTGQQKGTPPHPIPAEQDFPFPYAEDFESYPVGATPKWISDMHGTFEVAPCKGNRTGKCLEQILPQVGDLWHNKNPSTPITLFGSMNWTNYEISADVYVESGEIYIAVRKGEEQRLCGYALVFDKFGNWRIARDDITNADATLAAGAIPDFDGNQWHNLKIRAIGAQLDAYLDGIRIASLNNATRPNGQPCFGATFDLNQYDNLQVFPAGPRNIPNPWTTLNEDHPSITWYPTWITWPRDGSMDWNYTDGTCKFSYYPDSYVDFPFYGKFARIVGNRRADLGIMDIYIDNLFQTSVDCYNPSVVYQTTLYETDELPLDNHTIRIVVTGDHNPAASKQDGEIVLDAFASSLTGASWCPVTPLPADAGKPRYVDLTDDGTVNLLDVAWLCSQWLFGDCDLSCDCDIADLYHDGLIDLNDFTTLLSRFGELL